MSQAASIPATSPMSVWQPPPAPVASHCRYPVLQPLLPYITGILSVETACDLFDVYLTDPGSSLFRFAPPYILTRVFRRKSMVHQTDPRPMSSALLAAIMWCCAQAAELPPLLVPGARSRTIRALYDLTVALLNEKSANRWWRNESQSLSELNSADSVTTDDRRSLVTPGNEEFKSQLGAVDDVLTFILLCIAVSGGDFKSDCQEWWHRATRTARTLGLHREDEPCPRLGLTCTKPLCSCQSHTGVHSSAFLEAKEERRRVFWMLYCLDRHLGLSFNRVLQIPDSYVEVNGTCLGSR